MKPLNSGCNSFYEGHPYIINRPKGFPQHLLLLMHSPVRISINGGPFVDYDKNAAIILNKTTPRIYSNIGDNPLVNDWLQFAVDDISELHRFGVEADRVYPNIPTHYFKTLKHLIYKITAEQRERRYHYEHICDLQLELFFHILGQFANDTPEHDVNHPHFQLMFDIRNRMLNEFGTDADIEQAAKQAGLSPYYFRRIYKQIFHTTPQADVIQARLEHSKWMLRNTDDTIREVAENCGYQNEEHFMRQFKDRFGKSPTQYRKDAFAYIQTIEVPPQD